MALSDTATITAVAVSASDSVAVLAANTDRRAAYIYNDGIANIYLALGSTATTSAFTVLIGSGGFYEVPDLYTGAIAHKGSSATGTLRVTELT